ncbi:MAG: hypothetical protein ACFFDS_05685 [Candidatus Thorarchaeota archaeon]
MLERNTQQIILRVFYWLMVIGSLGLFSSMLIHWGLGRETWALILLIISIVLFSLFAIIGPITRYFLKRKNKNNNHFQELDFE